MQTKFTTENKAYMKLLDLGYDLVVWRARYLRKAIENGSICVSIRDLKVKNSNGNLVDEFGKGFTFESACEDYMNRIQGRLLVFDDGSGKEITIL